MFPDILYANGVMNNAWMKQEKSIIFDHTEGRNHEAVNMPVSNMKQPILELLPLLLDLTGFLVRSAGAYRYADRYENGLDHQQIYAVDIA